MLVGSWGLMRKVTLQYLGKNGDGGGGGVKSRYS